MSFRGQLRRAGLDSDGDNIDIAGALNVRGGLSGLLTQGEVFYLDPADGSDSYLGKTPGTAFETLLYAETQMTADQNDTLIYLSGGTSAGIVAVAADHSITWDKDFTHLIGVGAPLMNQNRARFFNSGNTTAGKNMMYISAKGCLFQDLMFSDGSAVATAYTAEVTGNYNVFNRVTFRGYGHATPAGNSTNYSFKLTGCNLSEFHNCTFGGTSTKRTADNSVVSFASICSQLLFKGCMFLSYAEVNTYPIVKIPTDGIRDWVTFDDCFFYNRWATKADQLLEVFELGTDGTHTSILLKGDSNFLGCDEWATGDKGVLWAASPIGIAGSAGVGSSGAPIEPT